MQIRLQILGKVDAIRLAGLDLRFYSSDHLPPHFHAIRRGEWNIRVYIRSTTKERLDYSMKWPKGFGGPPGKIGRELRRLVSENRAALLQEWENKVQVL